MADPKIITNMTSIQIPEGGQASFNVKLSSRPKIKVTEVKIKRVSGDESIQVANGEELKFSRKNYNQWKTVTLFAKEDSDHTNGKATFSVDGEHVSGTTISATEADNDSEIPSTFHMVTDRDTVSMAWHASIQILFFQLQVANLQQTALPQVLSIRSSPVH